jgi:hypothetical protein
MQTKTVETKQMAAGDSRSGGRGGGVGSVAIMQVCVVVLFFFLQRQTEKKIVFLLLHVTSKWRRINKKVGGNVENKFPTPLFMQEKSRRKVLRVTQLSVKMGALECYVQYLFDFRMLYFPTRPWLTMYKIKQKSDRARCWFGRMENRYLSCGSQRDILCVTKIKKHKAVPSTLPRHPKNSHAILLFFVAAAEETFFHPNPRGGGF